MVQSAMVTGVIVMGITLLAAWFTEETFHKDLNYIETEEMFP
jgi:sensor histidine kinase regulating citrate/malate metabolism